MRAALAWRQPSLAHKRKGLSDSPGRKKAIAIIARGQLRLGANRRFAPAMQIGIINR
jgi:hypothetical protein